jgi:hypothetical protein
MVATGDLEVGRPFDEIIHDVVTGDGDTAKLREELRAALEEAEKGRHDPDTLDVARLVLCALEDTDSEAPDEVQ